MELRKTFHLELEDYISFNLFHSKKQLLISLLAFIGLVPLFTLAISDSQDHHLVLSVSIILSIVIGILYALLTVFLLKRKLRKQYNSTRLMQAESEIIIDKAGLRQSNEFSNLAISWTDVFKAVESKKGFYLYISKMQAFIIPKHLVSAEEEKILRGLIDINLPSEKNRLKTDNINGDTIDYKQGEY